MCQLATVEVSVAVVETHKYAVGVSMLSVMFPELDTSISGFGGHVDIAYCQQECNVATRSGGENAASLLPHPNLPQQANPCSHFCVSQN